MMDGTAQAQTAREEPEPAHSTQPRTNKNGAAEGKKNFPPAALPALALHSLYKYTLKSRLIIVELLLLAILSFVKLLSFVGYCALFFTCVMMPCWRVRCCCARPMARTGAHMPTWHTARSRASLSLCAQARIGMHFTGVPPEERHGTRRDRDATYGGIPEPPYGRRRRLGLSMPSTRAALYSQYNRELEVAGKGARRSRSA